MTPDGRLVEDVIGAHLDTSVDNGDFLTAVRSIAHTLHLCSINFSTSAVSLGGDTTPSWIFTEDQLRRLTSLTLKGVPSDRLPITLQLISMLELSLTQLLVDDKGRRPNHLTAAINDPRLASILNPPTVAILKLLFGPVTSLNLRNLYWHGFISPSDSVNIVPVSLLHFLFALITCIGEQLADKQITTTPTQSRLTECQGQLCDNFLFSEPPERLIRKPPGTNLVFTDLINELSVTRRYQDATAISILCITSLVRNELCRVLDWPEGVLSAEDRFFLTLDAVLQGNLYKVYPGGQLGLEEKAKLAQRVGPENLLCLAGLFCAMEGPRLRERLAHGELFSGAGATPQWRSIHRRVRFCLTNILDYMHSSSTGTAISRPGDPVIDFRYDAMHPLARFAMAACSFWTTWAALYAVIGEVTTIPPVQETTKEVIRLWFPNLPNDKALNWHSQNDAVSRTFTHYIST